MLKQLGLLVVRLIGLEPTRRDTPEPKSGASANSATSAYRSTKLRRNGDIGKFSVFFFS